MTPIINVTNEELALIGKLRVMTEALDSMTASRDVYQREADAMAAAHKIERDGLSKLLEQALDERDHYIRERDVWSLDAELGRIAMRFVGRAGDYCDIDPAERICDQFYKAMADQVTANRDAAMKGKS